MRPTVLIVDDHAGFRQAARALLECDGYVTNIFSELDLPATAEAHRRVLAVLKYLQAPAVAH